MFAANLRQSLFTIGLIAGVLGVTQATAQEIFGPFLGGPPGRPGERDTRYGTQNLILNNGMYVLEATATGAYYSNNGGMGPPVAAYHYASNSNYLAFTCSSWSCDTLIGPEENANDFFVFDLSKVSGPIWSASLSIGNGEYGIGANNTDYRMWDVTTPISELEADHILGPGGYDPSALPIYNDLGSGLLYARVIVGLADNSTQIQIPLDFSALQTLNAAEGGSWAVGGSVIPEPASWILMLIGFGAMGCAAHRRTMKTAQSLAEG